MQFSVKTVLVIAIGMANLTCAAPAEGLDNMDPAGPSAPPIEVSAATDKSALRFRCCAYKGCSVCADYGHIDSCSPCGGVSFTPNMPMLKADQRN